MQFETTLQGANSALSHARSVIDSLARNTPEDLETQIAVLGSLIMLCVNRNGFSASELSEKLHTTLKEASELCKKIKTHVQYGDATDTQKQRALDAIRLYLHLSGQKKLRRKMAVGYNTEDNPLFDIAAAIDAKQGNAGKRVRFALFSRRSIVVA